MRNIQLYRLHWVINHYVQDLTNNLKERERVRERQEGGEREIINRDKNELTELQLQ